MLNCLSGHNRPVQLHDTNCTFINEHVSLTELKKPASKTINSMFASKLTPTIYINVSNKSMYVLHVRDWGCVYSSVTWCHTRVQLPSAPSGRDAARSSLAV